MTLTALLGFSSSWAVLGAVQEMVSGVIKGALSLHSVVATTFRKTAANFHYEFNVRHLSNVFQGMLMARSESIREPDHLVQLWAHECERIYGDRLVSPEHLKTYKAFAADLSKKHDQNQSKAVE